MLHLNLEVVILKLIFYPAFSLITINVKNITPTAHPVMDNGSECKIGEKSSKSSKNSLDSLTRKHCWGNNE